jgi:hydrogenase expression/formation protein HypD
MEFCGGHTHAISRYGVTDLLPASVKMIHGPGCPVCVLPIGRVDLAIALALEWSTGRRRVPEPLALAHTASVLARNAARGIAEAAIALQALKEGRER